MLNWKGPATFEDIQKPADIAVDVFLRITE